MKLNRLILTLFAILIAFSVYGQPAEVNPKVDVCGRVSDEKSQPIAGAVVSDGYSVVATDSKGYYHFKRNPASNYVFVSIPSGYQVPLRQGQPCFYRKIDDKRKSYDFVFEKMRKEEKSFNVYFIGDPQCQNTYHVNRLVNEGLADMRSYARKKNGNDYAITLGDIVYSEGGRNCDYLMPIVRDAMSADNTGMPVFQTIGNHDYEFARGVLYDYCPTPSLRRNRMFEAVFGPTDYSWNRGDVHFISICDVRYEAVDKSKYSAGISDAQLEWLKADLSFVPKDKMVVLCLHIPIATKNPSNEKNPDKKHDMENLFKAVELLSEYTNPMVFSGHTHTNFKNTLKGGVREFTVGAMSGCWWWSRNCADGSPNGYLYCRFEGNRLADYIYKGVGFSEKLQMRIYRGDAEFGGSYEAFPLQHGHDALLINVFNWDEDWTVSVYEDNRLMAENLKPMPLSKEYVPTSDSSKDWWAIGYNVGVVGRGHFPGSTRNNYCEKCWHMFKYKMTNPSAKIKVVVTDSAGRRFVETKIYDSRSWQEADYKDAVPPSYGDSQVW